MESALASMDAPPESFPSAAAPLGVAAAGDVPQRADRGSTTATAATCRSIVYFTGRGPAKTANCKKNEVDVPNVVGWKLAAAQVAARGRCR